MAVYHYLPKNFLRKRMYEYLDNKLDREDNIVLVADSLSRSVEKELLEYRDSVKIPVFPIFKKLRKKMGLADDTFSK